MTSFKVNIDCVKDGDNYTIGSFLNEFIESEDKIEDIISTIVSNTIINKFNEIKKCFVEDELDTLIDEYNSILNKIKEHNHSEE